MQIAFSKPVTYDGLEHAALTFNLEGLLGRDLVAVSKELRKSGEHILHAETDERYILAVAARSAGCDVELLEKLPARDFVKVKTEVQAFLLGSDSETSPS